MPQQTICQILHGLSVGGAEVLAARLARQLGNEFHFVFVCLDDVGTLGEQLRGEGLDVALLGRRPGVDWRGTRRLARILREQQADLLHAHQYTPFFYAITARLLYRRPPVLFTEHGRWFPDYPRRKRIIANRLLLQKRDRVVAVGEHVRQALIKNEGIAPERVGVIYNGIDLAPFTTGDTDRDAVRREIGVEPNDWVILQVARLDALKDHATAVRTLGHVVREIPNARLVMVGEGPELASIQENVRQHQLESHVRLLGLRRDVARLLSAADVLLLSSVSEGVPLTVIEAMAAGVPVVSTQVGGVAEIITHGETGLLAPSGDDRKLAEQIIKLARDRQFRERIAEAGRERAVEHFSERQMLEGYLRLYHEMLSG